jgi:hypothetical protein
MSQVSDFDKRIIGVGLGAGLGIYQGSFAYEACSFLHFWAFVVVLMSESCISSTLHENQAVHRREFNSIVFVTMYGRSSH